MSTSYNAFQETRNCFKEGTNYTSELTFDEWNQQPEELKAAILFVQFYNQITMAWFKASERYPFIDEEDAVAIAMQYLQKQVDRKIMTKERFTPQYIYQVAWQCISGIGWVERDQKRYANEVSEVVETAEGEVSLYDTVIDSQSGDFEALLQNREMSRIVNNLSPKHQKVLNYLMNGESLRKVTKRSSAYGIDPLTDVSVKEDEVPAIVEELKKIFFAFAVEKGYAFA